MNNTKYTLTLSASGYAPDTCEIDASLILCNAVNLPRNIDASTSCFNTASLYAIGHQFGAVCAVWADNVQDALDNAVDANMLDCFLAEEQNYEDESLTSLGNASELFDLSEVWMAEVKWDATRDIQLIVALVRASEAGDDNLGVYK